MLFSILPVCYQVLALTIIDTSLSVLMLESLYSELRAENYESIELKNLA